MKTARRWRPIALSMTMLFFAAAPVLAQTDVERIDDLERQATELAQQLAELRAELQKSKEAAQAETAQQVSAEDLQTLRAESVAARQAAQRAEKSANEWKTSQAITHLAGYASVDYISPENQDGAFVANFNPIFHYQYADKILWEAELEIEVEEDGSTAIGLEYSSIDLFLNDNLIFVAGKFLSPLGNFRQNGHPSWINKLVSAPSGFGHDGAAPASEVGMQLRGGLNYGQQGKFTYAAYIGNGPEIVAEDGEIHAIETAGFAGNADGEFVFGGRVSFLPMPKLEIGISAAAGDVAVVVNDGVDFEGDALRDYTVFGMDAGYRVGKFDLRAEYISQELGAEVTSIAPEGAKWESWFVQSAYRFGQTKWEGVLRYTDYTSPHADESQEQLAFGVNYLLTPSAMIKLAYESNSGLANELADDDRILVQVAYGY